MGDEAKDRAHQVVTAEDDAADDRRDQQTILPTRDGGACLWNAPLGSQQGDDGKHRNDGNILKQQDGEAGLARFGLQLAAFSQALQHNRRRGESQYHADRQCLRPFQLEQEPENGDGDRGQQHLAAAEPDNGPLELPEQGWFEFQTDQEQHQYHAKFRHLHDILGLADHVEQVGSYDDAGDQVTEHRA